MEPLRQKSDKNFMPMIDLFPRASAVGKFLCKLVSGPHLLASHGDHFRWEEDRLATPVEPVTDWPGEPTIEFNQGELFHLLNDDDITQAYLKSKMP